MGRKNRQKKKLARQQNNAGGKYVPPVNPAAGDKTVPPTATNSGAYKREFVRWTAREIDDVSGAKDGRRWDLDASETMELLKFLDELTGKTWGEWEGDRASGHKRHHDHPVTDLTPVAQERLRQLDENEERIFRFRLKGKCRLWGFRSGNLFRILWYDPEHSVYPVSKRHT